MEDLEALSKKYDGLDGIHKMVQSAIESAHTKPSRETLELIGKLEVGQKVLEATQLNIIKTMDERERQATDRHTEVMKAIDALSTKIDSQLEKKADKYVEKSLEKTQEDLKKINFIILTTIIGGILTFFLFRSGGII